MSLGNLWGLLALLGLPLVVFLHRRAGRTRRLVALVSLWRPGPGSAMRGARALRDPLLLVRLLLVTALAVALVEPGWPGAAPARHVIVLDASASMNARAAAGTRFRQAQDEAARILATLPAGDDLLVVRAGSPPTASAEWSRDRRHVRVVLGGLAPGEAPKDLQAALGLARVKLEGRPGLVHLVTDFVGDPTPLARRAGLGPGALRIHSVGGPVDNLAIVSAAVTPLAQSPLDHQVFALVANFTEAPRTVAITLTLPDGRHQRQRLALAPGARQPALFTIAAADRIELRLEGTQDALALDDRATLLPSPHRLRVLYVGEADPFVTAALRAHPGLELTRGAPGRSDDEGAASEPADVVVAERSAIPPGFVGPTLVLGGPAPKATRASPVVSRERRHPLLRGVDLRDVVVPAGRVLASAPADVLISSVEGPVATATQHGARRVELAFAVGDSTLGYATAFPILIARSLDWLAVGRSSGTNLVAGQPLDVPMPAAAAPGLTVRRPDGSLVPARVERGRLHFPYTDLTGAYVVSGTGIRVPFAVNLLNAAESDLRRAPGGSRDAGSMPTEPPDSTTVDRWTAVRIALAIALQLLSLEIWLQQRRAGAQPA